MRIIVTILCTAAVSYCPVLQYDIVDASHAGYVYFLASKRNNDKISRQYADAVVRYSKKYCLDPRRIARQIWMESEFKNTVIATNQYGRAYGCAQLKRCHDATIAATENYDKTVPIAEQYFWIYPSVEAMCSIMRGYLNTYFGEYKLAIVAYWFGAFSASMSNYCAGKWKIENESYYKGIIIDGWIEKHHFGL